MSGSPSPSRRSVTDSGGAAGLQPRTVAPQQVTDPTILESVAGFINEVVPTGSAGNVTPRDTRDQIQWVRFEQMEPDEDEKLVSGYEYDKIAAVSVVLVVGYTSGVQVWAIPPNGEAIEIMSWKHGTVKVLKFLPNPYIPAGDYKKDTFKSKRPLVAVCDSSSTNPPFSTLNFISVKTGEQEKVIKFKNAIIDVLANKRSVIVTFQEKIAVFDAFTLEDRLTVTTCYLSPGLNPNPVAIGPRWMAYAEKKLNSSKRSSGGSEGEGVQSYTATVLHAAKSFSRGLRELGESFASSLTGNATFKPGTSPNSPQAGGIADDIQKGVVTVLDIECPSYVPQDKSNLAADPIIAHFTATTEAIVYLKFDSSGMLLFAADKRGHDFHVFRIQSHPAGPILAAVHHLYVLHRGDTSARVQDVCFSPDSRWVVVSTMRGTSHVFPITTYGGNVGVRTHCSPHVVNKMSRFHRSAGLTADGRSNSPVSCFEAPSTSHYPYPNPRFPSYPHPTVINPLAQIRQPLFVQNVVNVQQRPQGRQRLSSSSEENIALKVASCFAPPRAWIDNQPRETTMNKPARPMQSLFIISSHGMLIQYDLEPHQASNVPKEKVCSETPIELTVCAKAQWVLQRFPGSVDQPLPISPEYFNYFSRDVSSTKKNRPDVDEWLSQVEIVTHAGPHRRLWMGPQFTFKTYTTSGSPAAMAEAKPLDLTPSSAINVPVSKSNAITIEAGSANSSEQLFLDAFRKNYIQSSGGENQLKEELADAMLESPGIRETGGRCVIVQMKPAVAKVVNPLGTVVNVHTEHDSDQEAAATEEIVIHENCDETLFRPVVTPITTACREMNRRYADEIMTKSLQPHTEVAVSLLKKEKPLSKTTKTKRKEVVKEKESTSKRPEEKPNTSWKSPEVMKPSPEMPEPVPVAKFIQKSPDVMRPRVEPHMPEPPIEFPKRVEIPSIDTEDFFSLETKAEKFEDAKDCSEEKNCLNKEKKKTKIKKRQEEMVTVVPDPIIDDKPILKLQRKPKSKLGVKIININNENNKKTEDVVDVVVTTPQSKLWGGITSYKPTTTTDTNETIRKKTQEDVVDMVVAAPQRMLWSSIAASKSADNETNIKENTEIAPSKKSWNTIAAPKCETGGSLLDSDNKENDLDLDLPKIEFVDKFMYLPTECIKEDLIDINTPMEEKVQDSEILVISECANLIKIYKSSDDEKVESSGSNETPESDDSWKACKVVSTDVIPSELAPTISRAARRKKRKK
ncbi:unnamed protein product [Acanthoscelides obtectus]|uniref:BCAS3 WD40 domain-containing protein n=1 Tax=Acanthoscelides obtectus TaxID=200917 RepID=A0A9P0NW57_ACAOB|nr:unnamed protein product [Acanthoscelides obtectus]CAK1668084.1 Breast carcinoma-amplified sequence 3 homolog [Acanthoscelides obtectus]